MSRPQLFGIHVVIRLGVLALLDVRVALAIYFARDGHRDVRGWSLKFRPSTLMI
jgi:hypothetical protein